MKKFNRVMWFPDTGLFIAEQAPLVIYDSMDGILWRAVESKEKIASIYEKIGAFEERNRIKNIGLFKRFLGKF